MKVSIIIPTKNGQQYLEKVLEMVFKQKASFDYEVVIIDSGSKDRTLEIIKKYPQIKLFHIKPEEFGHGRTRNLAVSKTNPESEYFVFLTQDAVPASENWLAKIIEPFEKDLQVAGVFGKHLPRKDCDPFQRKTLNEFMESFGKELTIYGQDKPDSELTVPERHFLNFFSNVNSAVRRSAFAKIPFQEVEMGEDQFWIKDILAAGYKKAYAPEAAVYHSHNYGIWNQFKRWFDEFRQHKINQNYVGVSTIFKVPYLTLRLWINDVRYIRSQQDYNLLQKFYWGMWIFFMDFARMCGEYIGGRYDKLPKWLQNKLSMQHELINK